jgi:hypothetical protein
MSRPIPELRATARAFVVGAFAALTSEKARVAGLVRLLSERVGCANSVEPGNPCFAAGSILETRCWRWNFDVGEADVIFARARLAQICGLGLVI